MKIVYKYLKYAAILVLTLNMLIGSSFSAADFARPTNEEWIYGGGLVSSQVRRVKLSAVGDLMVHSRQSEDALRKGGGGGVYNYDYSFSYIKRHFAQSGIVVGNLETVLNNEFRDFPLFSVTDEFAHALKNAGFTMLTTANNHSLDRGLNGLLRTLDVLDELEITAFGTYRTQEDRDNILIVEENGITFAFLSYSYSTNGIAIPGGRNYLINLLDESLYTADIRRARALNPDFIIVMPHWGHEYESHVRRDIRNIAANMFRAGADIILGHHPHVVQPAEFVTVVDDDGTERTGFVAYSMANFISGQRTTPRDAGVIFNLYFERVGNEKPTLAAVSYIPTWVKWRQDGVFNIAVMSVYDILTAHMWGGDTGLSQADINRVRNVQVETTRTITGTAVPVESIAPEYFIRNE